MLQQHASGRTSQANSSWEIFMPFEDPSPKARSLLAFARRRPARKSRMFREANPGTMPAGQSEVAELDRYRRILRPVIADRPKDDDGATPPSSAANLSWRVVRATASGLTLKILDVAARGEAGFSGGLVAAASWIAAQVLEGCAAYAEAMYPIALEPPDHLDAAAEQESEIEDSRTARLIVLRGDRRG
jgi:hypothetical protein